MDAKGHYRELFEQLRKQGYVRVRIDGKIEELREKMQLDRYKIHDIELVIDRIEVNDADTLRLNQSLQKALQLGKGLVFVQDHDSGKLHQYSKHLMDAASGLSYEDPSPNTFSFNSPYGACPSCKGLGVAHRISMEEVLPDKSKTISVEGGLLLLVKKERPEAGSKLRLLPKRTRSRLIKPSRIYRKSSSTCSCTAMKKA